ncbi:MAG: hypothetical protein KJP02_03785 [Octadecabacter sp.]|nr:hypothetical protein [Octadecabacter sp.]
MQLSRAGLTCWTPKRTRDGLLAGLIRHPALIMVEDEKKAARSVGRIRIEVERLSRGGQSALLISDENILGGMVNNLADMRLYPLLRERLMRFVPAFEGRKLRIGLCVRSFDDYWASVLAFHLPRGGSVPDQDLLDCLTTQPRRWRSLVRSIATVFPDAEIVVWPFERLAGQPQRQLEVMWDGHTGPLSDEPHWVNRANGLAALNELMALRGEHPLREGPVDADARWMPFSEDQLAVLRADYRRDIAWFKSGAEGLATFIDGRPTPAMPTNRMPDRAIDQSTGGITAVHIGGHDNGIEEGLGRTGAS